MLADQLGIEGKTFNKAQVWELVEDPKTWLMFFFCVWAFILNGGLTNFSRLIINSPGYLSQRSILPMMPIGVIHTLSSYICSFGVYFCIRRFPDLQLSGTFAIGSPVVGLIATVLLYTLPTHAYANRLLALYLSYFYLGPYIVLLGMNNANTAGHTKKVTMNAVVFAAYCVSNIITPQFFKANQVSLYSLGMGAMLTSYVLSIITISLHMMYCWNENRKRRKVDDRADQLVHIDTDFIDMTNQENIHFRYVW